jgi:hypothetical protein
MSDRKRRKLTLPQKWIALLALVVLLLGLGNVGRIARSVYYATHLSDLPIAASWTYLVVMGSFWSVAFLVCTVALIRLWRWGRWATLVTVTLYEVHVWINHLLLDANERARQLWFCDAVLTLGLLVFIWVGLNWPSVRKEFRDARSDQDVLRLGGNDEQ